MKTKSFFGDMRESVRCLYLTSVRGEVSDAPIRGYLRTASQIEDFWQQIDQRLAELLAQGLAPREAYAQLRYPLAFIRAARALQVFVQELLTAQTTFAQETAGYLPQIT